MHLHELRGTNFRNISQLVWYPSSHLNLLVGDNGQGKTSILESIGLLSSLRSFRGAKNEDLIKKNENSSNLTAILQPESSTTLKIQIDLSLRYIDEHRQKVGRTIHVNSKPFHLASQYLCKRYGNLDFGFHTIHFDPSSHDLVKGDPEYRRDYLDRAIMAENSSYIVLMKTFRRILEQRNSILKSGRISGAPSQQEKELLRAFTLEIAKYGAQITSLRLGWIARIIPEFRLSVRKIAPHEKNVSIQYVATWMSSSLIHEINFNLTEKTGLAEPISLEIFEREYLNRLRAQEAAEWSVGYTLSGPHRDDWQVLLESHQIKNRGSQGEIRTALLSLKLAEVELFRSKTGHKPILLLDDLSSELDLGRRQFLMRYLESSDLQAFITTTEDSISLGRRVYVENGLLSSSEDQSVLEIAQTCL